MKTLRLFAVTLVLGSLALFSAPADRLPLPLAPVALQAQATTTQTTLSADVTKTQSYIVVASATGFVKGYITVVDGEVMQVAGSYVSGTTIPVVRAGSASAHASGAVVFAGPPSYFSSVDPVGPCTSTNETALPRVVIGTDSRPSAVNVYNCSGASSTTQRWQLYTRNGYPAFQWGSVGGTPAGAAPPGYASDGAVSIIPGLSFLSKSSAGAYTLAAPSLYQNGMVMILYASTAQAHTVTYTAGFFGTTTSSDVATYGGAIGDNLVIVAQNGTWRAVSTRNVTIA